MEIVGRAYVAQSAHAKTTCSDFTYSINKGFKIILAIEHPCMNHIPSYSGVDSYARRAGCQKGVVPKSYLSNKLTHVLLQIKRASSRGTLPFCINVKYVYADVVLATHLSRNKSNPGRLYETHRKAYDVEEEGVGSSFKV